MRHCVHVSMAHMEIVAAAAGRSAALLIGDRCAAVSTHARGRKKSLMFSSNRGGGEVRGSLVHSSYHSGKPLCRGLPR